MARTKNVTRQMPQPRRQQYATKADRADIFRQQRQGRAAQTIQNWFRGRRAQQMAAPMMPLIDQLEDDTYPQDIPMYAPPAQVVFTDDLDDIALIDPADVGQAIVAPVPAIHNSAIGQITVTQVNVQDYGQDVPIYNYMVRVHVTDDEADIVAVQRAGMRALFEQVFTAEQLRDAYGQVRLNRFGDMRHDLVTPMVPVNSVSDEFEIAYNLYAISETDIDPREVHEVEFNYTFVFPGNRPINPNMVRATTQAFAQSRSAGARAPNLIGAQARFMAMQHLHRSGTFNPRRIDIPLNLRQRTLRRIMEERRRLQTNVRANAARLRREAGIVAPRNRNPRTRALRRPLTAEQRERYNARRRARYQEQHPHQQRDAMGVYADLKKRIFHHTSLEEFFRHSKSVIDVPTTHEEGLCLIMALIRSESRWYDLETCSIHESIPLPHGTSTYRTFPIKEEYQERLQNSPHFSFLSVNDEGQYEGVLFNPYKLMLRCDNDEDVGSFKYAADMAPNEIQSWYVAAQALLEYMESYLRDALGEDYVAINPNKEESFLQAACDVFEIYIAVYRPEMMGMRCNIYKPLIYDEDIRKNGGTIEVVSILIGENHASAISSLREFVKSKSSANRMHIQNYCLICERKTTANNATVEACKKHFAECMEKRDGRLKCCIEHNMKKQLLKDYSPSLFAWDMKRKEYMCRTCRTFVDPKDDLNEHVCYISKPDKNEIADEKHIYVYDFEAAQMDIEGHEAKQHDVNLVCVRRAYKEHDLDRRAYCCIDDFMQWVMSRTDYASIYIAHNGGHYDVQFVMRYLEKNGIVHTFIPAPSSMHAYLSVTIPFGAGKSATFLDFRNFMPGSLDAIGKAFGLEVAKGKFPHHFNDGWRNMYRGAIPNLEDPRDFWCLKSVKSETELEKFHEWYAEQCTIYCTCATETCTCGKEPWVFQTELVKYCWLDVDVLAEAAVKYRDNALAFGLDSNKEDNCGWQPSGIDPYCHLTIAQMAMKLLLMGTPNNYTVTVTPNKVRNERVPLAIAWMERISQSENVRIRHIGNSNLEQYCAATNRFLDGYCKETGNVYLCLNCIFHGCLSCYYTEIQTGANHPSRPGTYGAVHHDTKAYVETLIKYFGVNKVKVVWECELTDYSDVEVEMGNIMKERDCFYGGRTEAFSPFTAAPVNSGRQIKYKDVCSLYPYICAFKRLPIGNPIHYFHREIDPARFRTSHPDRYFGFVRCKVIPNRRHILGLLPYRDPTTGRLEFPLEPWVGCFGTEELALALDHGYELGEIYECFHWTTEESSDTLLRGYIAFFLRMKQEAEGWKKLGASTENPSDEEAEALIEHLYRENGGIARIRRNMVTKNPTKRQLAKIFLNSLWGKFCQRPHKEHYVTIHGQKQFYQLWNDPTIDKSSFLFRYLHGSTWKVRYSSTDAYTRPNPKYNIFLAAKVTEWARTILHTEMIQIGPENILYCDTDSLMYLCPENEIITGHGLGEWVDEYPNDRIVKLYCLAPKFYFLLKESGESLLKSKGVQLTVSNVRKINEESLAKQILELTFPIRGQMEFESTIEVDNMIIGVNSTNARIAYGTMLTRFTEPKKVRPVFSKRTVVQVPVDSEEERPDSLEAMGRVVTIPKGYYLSVEQVANEIYNINL